MQTRQTFFPPVIAFAAIVLGFATGVYSASSIDTTKTIYAECPTNAPRPAEDFDYFPSHYVDQATD